MTKHSQKILLVDDDDNIRWILNELLLEVGYEVVQVGSAEQALDKLSHSSFDLLISDIRMPGKSGMDLLDYCQQQLNNLPVIIMTAHSDLESAVQAYQQGAFEYLPKPFELDEVIATVERALSAKQITQAQPAPPSIKSTFSIIGESPAMQDLYRAIGRLSNSQVTVLIHGESGTGKELVARALHQHSPRKNASFIALNMAAIPKDLIESELFGHEKGAFTGANSRYLGRFEQANNGTLFLDEIGDMPLDTQTRLLRVLSEGAFYRIGSTQPTQVNVRIIAATHQNLRLKVEAGEFREDLYHRLNVIPLQLPPLRNRSSDIPLLAHYFLHKIAAELNEPQKTLSDEALSLMQQFSWSGNVRQLENICRWLSVMPNSQLILASDLPDELLPNKQKQEVYNTEPRIDDALLKQQDASKANSISRLSQSLTSEFNQGNSHRLIQVQSEFEQMLIKTALSLCAGKKADAAKLLGWGRNTLTRKINNQSM
jgi:two-component system, NtrC family, nitrogen regulation response regulator GlnG